MASGGGAEGGDGGGAAGALVTTTQHYGSMGTGERLYMLALQKDREDSVEEAGKLYEAAAQKGHAAAQLARGMDYYVGQRGVAQDAAISREWFQLSAEGGNRSAMNWLGMMLCDGVGGALDLCAGLEFLEQAAGRGELQAATLLSGYYLRHGGCGTLFDQLPPGSALPDVNVGKAVMFARLAAESGNGEALMKLGQLLIGAVRADDKTPPTSSHDDASLSSSSEDCQCHFSAENYAELDALKHLPDAITMFRRATLEHVRGSLEALQKAIIQFYAELAATEDVPLPAAEATLLLRLQQLPPSIFRPGTMHFGDMLGTNVYPPLFQASEMVERRARNIKESDAEGAVWTRAGPSTSLVAEEKPGLRMSCVICGKTEGDAGVSSIQYCAGCSTVQYCGQVCQRYHWKKGGHKQICKEIAKSKSKASMKGGGAASGQEDEKEFLQATKPDRRGRDVAGTQRRRGGLRFLRVPQGGVQMHYHMQQIQQPKEFVEGPMPHYSDGQTAALAPTAESIYELSQRTRAAPATSAERLYSALAQHTHLVAQANPTRAATLSLYHIGEELEKVDEYAAAAETYHLCLDIGQRCDKSSDDVDLNAIMMAIGVASKRAKKFAEAEMMYKRCLRGLMMVYDPNPSAPLLNEQDANPGMKTAFENLAILYEAWNEVDRGCVCFDAIIASSGKTRRCAELKMNAASAKASLLHLAGRVREGRKAHQDAQALLSSREISKMLPNSRSFAKLHLSTTMRESADEQCALCFSPFAVGKEREVTQCEHAFHMACMLPWGDQQVHLHVAIGRPPSISCPVCDTDISNNDAIAALLVRTGEHGSGGGAGGGGGGGKKKGNKKKGKKRR
jgi:TPR repeat protein/tetratricopeptide (TPR) repeat protein